MALGDDKSDSLFLDVVNTSPDNIQTKEYTPASGEELYITDICIGASGSKNCDISLIWDYGGGSEEILFSSSLSIATNIKKTITGDGTKKLAIVIRNNCTQTYRMGMIYEAEVTKESA